MLFNSYDFFVFLPIVFILYWTLFNQSILIQNLFVLICSYVFYGWWDYRFLSLIFISTLVDYFVGLSLGKEENEDKRNILLYSSVVFNLGVLGIFKYYNFFVESWIELFSSIGYEINSKWTLNLILPIGISFYTFQTMSYTIDVYRKKLNPTYDFIAFGSFVSFFPQLVAGPIEKATNLLPQLLQKRQFNYNYCVQGLRLILWGMFKKVVIADSIAPLVNEIYRDYQFLDGGTLILGAIYFAFQIYCDFSGYSDIAIGTAKLFGIEIKSNFNFPFFSRNIVEFWRRWHISLTNWFTDYLFIPLKIKYRNSNQLINLGIHFLYFCLIGLWHGANWTHIFFGIMHGIYFLPTLYNPFVFKTKTKQVAVNKILPSFTEFIQIIITFLLVTLSWIFFRSETLFDAFNYISKMTVDITFPTKYRSQILPIIIFISFEWFKRKDERFKKPFSPYILVNRLIYCTLILYIIHGLTRPKADFIYFQF